MKKEWKKSTVIIALVIIILIQILARIYVGFRKEYIHMDEAYSYALMHYDKIGITDNDDFYNQWHTKDYYLDYLRINEGEEGNWQPVYENQKNDVHPPLYYALLRIAALFTINEYTKWTGLILNMIIWVGSSLLIYLIANHLCKNQKMALLICLITGLTLGALDTSAYIRMYELANFFVLLITYLHIRIYEKQTITIKEICPIAVSVLLGSLTHYYIIIYTAFLCILFVIKYISTKEYKSLIQYVAGFAIAAAISLMIFPYSLQHIFGGYRGQEAQGNLLNLETLFTNIGLYLYILTKNLFGKLAIVAIILYLVLYLRKRKETFIPNKTFRLIWIPTLFYFIIVAQISAYKELRYIMPIVSTAMIGAMYVFYQLLEKYLESQKAQIVTAIFFSIMIVSPAFMNIHLDFTFTQRNHLAERMEQMAEVPGIYIFNENNNRFLDDITIFTKLNESYIIKSSETNIETLEQILKEKEVSKGLIIVYNDEEKAEEMIEQLKEVYHYKTVEYVQQLNAATIKYIH